MGRNWEEGNCTGGTGRQETVQEELGGRKLYRRNWEAGNCTGGTGRKETVQEELGCRKLYRRNWEEGKCTGGTVFAFKGTLKKNPGISDFSQKGCGGLAQSETLIFIWSVKT